MNEKRVITGFALGALVIITLIFDRGTPFRALIVVAAIIAITEIWYAYRSPSQIHHANGYDARVTAEQTAILAFGAAGLCLMSTLHVVLIMVGVCGADTAAYVVGRLLGRKLIRKRPLPELSPNKNWEGIIGGTLGGMLAVLLVLLYYYDGFMRAVWWQEWLILATASPLAIVGDILGSRTKRALQLKDSGDCLRDHPFFSEAERILAAHGGYLDRLDSITFAALGIFLLTAVAEIATS